MVEKVSQLDVQRRLSGAELIRQLSQQKLGADSLSDELLPTGRKKSTTIVKRYSERGERSNAVKLLCRQHSVATTDSRRAALVHLHGHRNWRSCEADPRESPMMRLDLTESRQASLSLTVEIERDPTRVAPLQAPVVARDPSYPVGSVPKIEGEPHRGDKSGDGLSRRARIVIILGGAVLLLMCLVLVGVTLRLAPLIDEIVRRENENLLPSLTASNSTSTGADATETSSGDELLLNSLNVSLSTLT